MVQRPKGPRRDDGGAVAGAARDARAAGGVDRIAERHRWQNGGEPPHQSRRARPGDLGGGRHGQNARITLTIMSSPERNGGISTDRAAQHHALEGISLRGYSPGPSQASLMNPKQHGLLGAPPSRTYPSSV
jgi:hypothetical protein